MAVKLATSELSAVNDAPFRNLLISNFITTQEALNELLTYQGNISKQLSTLTTNINTSVDGKLTKQDSVLVDKLKAQSQDLTERINHVIMGTDTDSIHAVLNKMFLDGELRGQRGDAGKDGRDGLDGESTYQIWLDAGNVGSKADYLASMKGKPGDKGPAGPAGKDGAMSSADVKTIVTGLGVPTDTGGWQHVKVTSDDGGQLHNITQANGLDLNQEVLAVNGVQTFYVQYGATNNPSTDSMRGLVQAYNGFGMGFFMPTNVSGTAPWTVTILNSKDVIWKRLVFSDDIAAATSILKGKTLDIIGDSYVANNGKPVSETWHYKIANQHSMKYNNYGINGNGLVTTKATGTPVVNRVSTMDSSADYIVVVGGKNDYNQQLAITDFKAGLVKLIQELVERFVGKKICFFTPWSIVESETMNIPLAQYSQAIEDVCGAYSIPCFNSSKRSGILAYSGAFQTKYFQTSTDRSHLNSAGHDLFVNPATKFLESL